MAMDDSEEPATKKAKLVEGEVKEVGDGETEKVEVKQNTEGESYFDISRTRRATVRKFKGKVMVDIREFYGESPMKPGKKGISLSPDQYNALRSVILSGRIDEEIAKLEN